MEIRHLQCFMTVAKELHFGRAAERLSLSQSSVSEAIKSLETHLGGSLFNRTSRRVALTELGQSFLKGISPALMMLESSIDDCKLQATGQLRQLRVGFLGGGFYELHTPLTYEFKRTHPKVGLQFIELNYTNHFSAISDGVVDVGFCRLPMGGDSLTPGPIILRDQRLLCVPSAHPLASAPLVDPEALAQEKMLRMVPGSSSPEWQDYHFPRFTPSGRPIGSGPVVRTVREAIAMVNAKEGVFMITKRAAAYYGTPNITFVEIDLPSAPSALVRRQNDLRPIQQEFERVLIKIAKRYGTMTV
ncbi:MAG: LysR family transcriptional regulator [Burkholderiaceae bacterium]|nr:LysR family transcriptional regulator [Burkholderiaceae bacterium]